MKRSNGFGYTNLDHSRSLQIEKRKRKKNGFGRFSKFFVPIRVGLNHHVGRPKQKTRNAISLNVQYTWTKSSGLQYTVVIWSKRRIKEKKIVEIRFVVFISMK